jgi:hypothetical protein
MVVKRGGMMLLLMLLLATSALALGRELGSMPHKIIKQNKRFTKKCLFTSAILQF